MRRFAAMEHKGIQYALQHRPGLEQWTWTIYLNDGQTKRGEVRGTRTTAEERAKRAITEWLQSKARAERDPATCPKPPS
jgi:hypothetical protein